MITAYGQFIERVQIREAIRAAQPCYKCGTEPSYIGGLGADCMFDRNNATA